MSGRRGHSCISRVHSKDFEQARENILFRIMFDRHKVMYVDGWNGFGGTAVLRYIAGVLQSRKTTPELCFERIIFIDCSEWKSTRAMQREITKELKLHSSVMAIFDKQDEEDDFHGVDQGSRDVILSVSAMIYQTLTSHRFMMVLLNGSDDEVDVTRFGIPHFTEFCNNKMVWTFSRRCFTINYGRSSRANKLIYSDAIMYCHEDILELTSSEFHGLLGQEVAAIIAHVPCMLKIDTKIVEDCCLYDLFLYYFHTTTKFAWVGHASNYWICDEIVKGHKANDISNALRQEINWKCDISLLEDFIGKLMKQLKPPFLVIKDDDVYEEGPYRWISVRSRNTKVHGMQTIPAVTSSFFLAFETSGHPQTLPNGLFEYSNNLGVLVLCSCAFNFASPPFHKCQKLRFLGLDYCTHSKTAEEENHTEWVFLYNLLVLDLRYTYWDAILSEEKMGLMKNITELNIEGDRCWQHAAQLQGGLPNLQRLRIIKPTCPWEVSNDVDDSFIEKTSMEILDLSGNSDMKILPRSLTKASSLQMLVLDGCDGLENIGRLPPSLKCFSFDGNGPASQRTPTVELPPEHFRPPVVIEKDVSISKISLEGCTQLINLFLRGLNNLVELDLSGTAIKILDFKTMVVQVPRLKRLFLIGCNHLCAINFLSGDVSPKLPSLELVCIDTRAGIMYPRPSIDKTKSFRLQVHAIVVDARLAHSLFRLLDPMLEAPKGIYYNIHVTSSTVYDGLVQFEETNNDKFDRCDQGSLQQLIPAGQYSDVLSMVGEPPTPAFPQPPATRPDQHIEIAEGSCYVESAVEGPLGELMKSAESLHLRDVPIHAIVPEGGWWSDLRWCRVERCPKLDTVFSSSSEGFSRLETLWASDLLMARWIVRHGSRNSFLDDNSFKNLQHLHLRSCPSLQFVLPVWVSSFPSLETLHIIHCGDLSHVFVLDEDYPEEITTDGIVFPKLKTIYLHDLPKLHQISEVKMVAPALESIKIRGCWGLRRLPSVVAHGLGVKKPTVEIEKDVWDALEWDDGHRPDHFEAPIHSRFYKKKLPRVSFLR